MRFDGKLRSWNDERGFGFIEPRLGGQDIFVHIRAFPPGTGRPTVGLGLTFDVELGANGKKRAANVQFVRTASTSRRAWVESPAPWTWPRLVVLPCFVGLYAIVATVWTVEPLVALVYVAASVATFIAYGFDKAAARGDRWRTTEETLHVFSLACGWPGALLAQQWMQHKTSKDSFVAAYWATVFINVSLFVVLHTPWLRTRRPW